MKSCIFIASYRKDFPFLYIALKSVEKFCHGFSRVNVAVPKPDRETLETLLETWRLAGMVTITEQNMGIPNGFMRAQESMMCMDQHVPEADVFYLIGSDSMFWNHVTPSHYFIDGKPYMFAETVEDLRKRGNNTLVWLPGTTKALGFKPEHDYMRQLPLLYTPRVMRETRHQLHKHTGKTVQEYLQVAHKDFSESNVMGATAWKYCPEEYSWSHTQRKLPHYLIPFWSHGGLDHGRHPDRHCQYVNRFGEKKITRGHTAREVALDVLGDIFSVLKEEKQ